MQFTNDKNKSSEQPVDFNPYSPRRRRKNRKQGFRVPIPVVVAAVTISVYALVSLVFMITSPHSSIAADESPFYIISQVNGKDADIQLDQKNTSTTSLESADSTGADDSADSSGISSTGSTDDSGSSTDSGENQESPAAAQSSSNGESDANDSGSNAGDGDRGSKERNLVGEPDPDEKVVYITIDDGPTSQTPEILDILDEYNAKATWFVTAQYLDASSLKDMIKEISDRGHAIGVHTYSHKYKEIYASVDAFVEDYNKMNQIVIDAIGEGTNLIRFPGGSNASYNKNIREELIDKVNSMGLIYYDWNAFTGDTDGYSCSEMIDKAVNECSYNNKAILLMHDVPGKDAVVEALPTILKELAEKGYEFHALDEDVLPIQFVN